MYVYIYINQKISTKSLTTSFFEDKYIISSKAKRSGREEKILCGRNFERISEKIGPNF